MKKKCENCDNEVEIDIKDSIFTKAFVCQKCGEMLTLKASILVVVLYFSFVLIASLFLYSSGILNLKLDWKLLVVFVVVFVFGILVGAIFSKLIKKK